MKKRSRARHAHRARNLKRNCCAFGEHIVSNTDKIVEHINAALAYDASRTRRITTPQAFSKGKSTRPECLMCGVGIRKETTPVNGMHPKCARVASDPAEALKMGLNTHAARALHDRIVVQQRKNNDEIAREEAEKIAHAELLARFEANESNIESAS
jgi:hypothetical protein